MLIQKKDLHSVDFEKIEINSIWNSDSQKEDKMHRIHAYPAKFPAFIVNKALQHISSNGTIETVADVFCGCGTTAYEARRNGKNFWGCDINPVATLISRTKSRLYKIETIECYYNGVKRKFNDKKNEEYELCHVNERIHYWFEQNQVKDLLSLRIAIYETIPSNSKYKSFFFCAFSNILKSTSKWLQKSIKPTIDKNKNIVNVWRAFEKQIKMMKIACQEGHKIETPNIKIETTSIINKRIKCPKVDLIITSPPYVTSYEYADLHQMSALWLGFADDYRELRKGAVGSCYGNSDLEENQKKLNETGKTTVEKLIKVDKNRSRNVAKYFVDMQKSIKQSYLLLKTRGHAVFVIGNTKYKQVSINNAKHLVESMFSAGFQDIEIHKRKISNKMLTPYRSQSGKFAKDKRCRKIYAEEFVIIGYKQ